jgi:hypothetical protein
MKDPMPNVVATMGGTKGIQQVKGGNRYSTVCSGSSGTEFIESCRSRRNASPIYDWMVFWRFLKNYDAGRGVAITQNPRPRP